MTAMTGGAVRPHEFRGVVTDWSALAKCTECGMTFGAKPHHDRRKEPRTMELKRTEDEVWEQVNQAEEQTLQGGTKWSGMTYEQGVANAIRWMTGDDDTPPMEDEE